MQYNCAAPFWRSQQTLSLSDAVSELAWQRRHPLLRFWPLLWTPLIWLGLSIVRFNLKLNWENVRSNSYSKNQPWAQRLAVSLKDLSCTKSLEKVCWEGFKGLLEQRVIRSDTICFSCKPCHNMLQCYMIQCYNPIQHLSPTDNLRCTGLGFKQFWKWWQ